MICTARSRRSASGAKVGPTAKSGTRISWEAAWVPRTAMAASQGEPPSGLTATVRATTDAAVTAPWLAAAISRETSPSSTRPTRRRTRPRRRRAHVTSAPATVAAEKPIAETTSVSASSRAVTSSRPPSARCTPRCWSVTSSNPVSRPAAGQATGIRLTVSRPSSSSRSELTATRNSSSAGR